ncbi:MAG: HAD family hydrolase [Clostridia bacterium]|nr:HAD family hydrolase [Clostridia bacterium]
MKAPKAIFFDLDDTLIASDPVAPIAWERSYVAFVNRYAPAFSVDALHEARLRADAEFWSDPERNEWGRAHIDEARRRILRASLASLYFSDASAADAIADQFARLLTEMIHLLPGARDALASLRRLGLRLALVTNGDSRIQRAKIAQFDLDGYFEAIFIDTEIGFRKPDPRMFTHALRVMDLHPSEVWMVGDKLSRDVLGARRAGIFAVWNDYRQIGLPANAPAIPDLIIHSVAELPDILCRSVSPDHCPNRSGEHEPSQGHIL